MLESSAKDVCMLGHLGEVVSLYEVSGDVPGWCTIDTGGNVMPGHAGVSFSVQLVWGEEREREKLGKLA